MQRLSAAAISKLFGDGFGADLTGRGTVYLAEESRKALGPQDEHLTRVRLRAGESYTVVARPAPTRRERKLARSQRVLEQRYAQLSRPTRKQVRAARRLARSQHRLDRSRSGTRRAARRRRIEASEGLRFDRLMRPGKQLVRVSSELSATTSELNASRAAHLEHARRRRTSNDSVTVYD